MIRRVYFCANIWLSFVNKEKGRYQAIEPILLVARKGRCEVVTSAISIAEVYKSNVKNESSIESDWKIDNLFEQHYVEIIATDITISKEARALLRHYNPPLKKPFDAIHLATALRYDCDIFYTFDRDDLLRLNGEIGRADGQKLIITKPEIGEAPLFRGAQ